MTEPRGIRQNNPGNIRHGDKWAGRTDDQPDPSFVKFKSPEYGIRAMARILLQYEKRGINTPREIISTWAPSVENDTDAYVRSVCDACNFDEDQILDLDDCETILPLIKAIIKHENGKQPYKDTVILDGLRLAGINGVVSKPVMKQPAMQATTVATVGGALTVAGEVARQVRDVQDTAQTGVDFLTWMASYGPWMAMTLIVVGGATGMYAIWKKNKRTGF